MKVAVVDDTREDAQRLMDYLNQFQEKQSCLIQTDVYNASIDFLEEYHSQYDVIFLDIEMPGADGLEVAHEIRRKDTAVGIIFVTNIAQYAIHGYEVNAIDFIVKPVGYYLFAEKLEKAIRFANRRKKHDLVVNDEEGIYRIPIEEVFYIKKDRNDLIYYTSQGELKERGTIRMMKEKLAGLAFEECNSGCLVNLSLVRCIGKETVLVGNTSVPLSRRMRKQFTQSYIDYIGGGI